MNHSARNHKHFNMLHLDQVCLAAFLPPLTAPWGGYLYSGDRRKEVKPIDIAMQKG